MAEDITHTAVIVLTRKFKITGYIDLMPGARLTDYIAAVKSFFAVTEAVVEDLASGKVVLRSKFLDINQQNVDIILPADAIIED